MKIRKFIAGSSREALRLVREALGDDAVVLSNRAIEGGVELVALAEDELASLASPTDESERRAARAARRDGQSQASQPAAAQAADGYAQAPYAGGQPPQPSQQPMPAPAQAAYPQNAPRTLPPMQAPPQPSAAQLNPYSPQGLAAQNAQLSGALVAGEDYDMVSAAVYAEADDDGYALPMQMRGAPSAAGAPVAGASTAGSSASAGFSDHLAMQTAATTYGPSAYPNRLPDPFASTFGQPSEPQAAKPAHAESAPSLAPRDGDALSRALAARAALASINQHVVPLTPAEAASKGLGRTAPANDGTRERQPPETFLFNPVQPEPQAPFIHRARSADEASRGAAELAPQAPRMESAPAATESTAQAVERHEAMFERMTSSVLGELHAMRGALEEQLAGLHWSDRQRRQPVRNQVTKTLLATGFSAQFTKLLLDRLPAALQEPGEALDWAKAAIERNLPVLDDEDAMMERGGVYALMGPTGVGKTTTTAKLAARCVMRFGAERVALLTTDSYRIGAHEQLRIYGKILGVSVHAVKDAADLKLTLDELRNKHIVLIDTIGMSQRDRALTEQVAMLSGTGRPVRRLLLLNATSHGDTLNEVVHAYRAQGMHGAGPQTDLAGCILTKLDEATNIGAVLDTVIRYRLPVHYVSTGQKVPENLYVASKPFLMKSAFCIPRESSPFTPVDDDFPVLMAGAHARSAVELSEVRFG